jgi:WD40 repeat protein
VPKDLRVFISSPGDVPDERLRTALVLDKLAQDYARHFTIKSYRWEHEPMLASGHFQDVIEPPSAFDIVVLILWSRLGTPLPPKTDVREYRGGDGRVPVTGTEWEFEDALAGAKTEGAPAILVFRNANPAPIETFDAEFRTRQLSQIEALDRFWKRNFANRGTFLAAYDRYTSLEEFAARLEQVLRKIIEKRILEKSDTRNPETAAVWPGAPFRGLQSYEAEHAAIYFGRDEAVARVAEQLAVQARSGSAFLLVLGASGSGKSSLVKAGLVPRLMKPQRIEGIEFLRYASFRPATGADDMVLAFVEAIVSSSGRDNIGLPELVAPGQTLLQLAEQLKHSPSSVGFLFNAALGRVTMAARESGRLLAFEEAKFILIVDQLEELFTAANMSAESRHLFIQLLEHLARSGSVWIVATMRSDFWYRTAEVPGLAELAQGRGRIDLLPPSPAELAEMIRRPAQSAGLSFETHSGRGVGLDAIIGEDASAEPGVLPLLSFALDALYTMDVMQSGGHILTCASYEQLGSLKGAIARRADETVASLPAEAQAAVPMVLRSLISVSTGSNAGETGRIPVARAASLNDFATGSAARTVIDALTDARLVVAAGGEAVPMVRFAHEALISFWWRATDQIAADVRDLEVRVLIERQQLRWSVASETERKQLLLRDPDLANGVELASRWREELPAHVRQFIALSYDAARAAERRKQALYIAIMLCLATLAVASLAGLSSAQFQRNQALVEGSLFLARDAQTAIATGDVTLGSILSLNGMPRSINNANRPFVKEAEYALENAYANRRERLILRGHSGALWSVGVAPDGAHIVTGSSDGTAGVWNTTSGFQTCSLRGHRGEVQFVGYSPDNNLIVTASTDKAARIWNARNCRLMATLRGHGESVNFATFSPDSKQLVTASDDGTARIWDAATGTLKNILQGHHGLVNSAIISPDGRRVVTTSTDRTAAIWDMQSGKLQTVLRGHTGFVQFGTFSPDSQTILTVSWDSTARLWEAESGRCLATLEGHHGRIWDGEFSSDGKYVVTASEDKTARVWDVTSHRNVALLAGHEASVNTATFSRDGRMILTASDDETARLWDARTGNVIALLRGHQGLVNSALFFPDGRHVVTISYDKTAHIWDVESRAAARTYLTNQGWLEFVALSPDGKMLATASDDGTAKLMDVRTGNVIGRPLNLNADRLEEAAFSPDGRHIATASLDKSATIWDIKSQSVVMSLLHPSPVNSVSYSPDGKRIVTGSTDGKARIWNAASAKLERTLDGHADWVMSAQFSPDGARIVTSSYDKTARIWDARTGSPLARLAAHTSRVVFATFSPNGQRIVTASWDNTARVWDAATYRPISILRGHTNWVWHAEFSPDSRRVVTSSEDGTVRTWDPDTGAEILVLRGHGARASAAVFSPGGDAIVSSSFDTTVRIWSLPPRCQSLLDVERRELIREPTAEERDHYFLRSDSSDITLLSILGSALAVGASGEADKCE